MTADAIVRDTQLLSVLSAADRARQQCLSILDLLEAHHSSETTGASTSSVDIQSLEKQLAEQRKALNAHLAKVRGLNRTAILNVRKTKQETADARGEVDTLHLQLQNLKYEQSHLRRQIGICEGFDHPYQSLPLIPVDEFLALAPQHAELEEHELMLARIQHEHDEREATKNKQMGLLKKKEELMHENSKRKVEVDKLDKQLEDFVTKGTKSILDTFENVKMTTGEKA
ncbi:hypothetical protein EJ08DRAFT_673746 [Tothia fuscella]|uniref:THO complex subunit 5 n=1 Tax=Tothia fuscella TaxID=1048955 RepID=A0A9P4NE57_9PEZI|nr:hypothetical protein EJ08DRAFT_673746 [Tothia fuscella]